MGIALAERCRKKDLISMCWGALFSCLVNILVCLNKKANNFETARWIFLNFQSPEINLRFVLPLSFEIIDVL